MTGPIWIDYVEFGMVAGLIWIDYAGKAVWRIPALATATARVSTVPGLGFSVLRANRYRLHPGCSYC